MPAVAQHKPAVTGTRFDPQNKGYFDEMCDASFREEDLHEVALVGEIHPPRPNQWDIFRVVNLAEPFEGQESIIMNSLTRGAYSLPLVGGEKVFISRVVKFGQTFLALYIEPMREA